MTKKSPIQDASIQALARGNHLGVAQKIHDKIILGLNPQRYDDLEQVAKFLFKLAASREEGVFIQRVYASLEALDAALLKVGKKINYEEMLDSKKSHLPSTPLDLDKLKKLSKEAQQARKAKKKKKMIKKKTLYVTYRTRRRKIKRRLCI